MLRRQLFQHIKTQWILSGLIPKRDAQSQHEVAIKHTCLAGETKSFENKVVLSWPRKQTGGKQESKMSESMGATRNP